MVIQLKCGYAAILQLYQSQGQKNIVFAVRSGAKYGFLGENSRQ